MGGEKKIGFGEAGRDRREEMARDGQASGGTEMKRKRKESGRRRRRESGTRVNCRGNGLSRENTRHL